MVEEVEGLMRNTSVVDMRQDLIYSGFYSTYYLVPRKDGDIHPILKLKRFNANIRSKHFRMETLLSVLAALHPGLWLASLDLKDTYLHFAIRPVASTLPEVPFTRNRVPVLLSSIRTVKGLYKDLSAACSPQPFSGGGHLHLSG